MSKDDSILIWEAYSQQTINEGPPVYVDPHDDRAGGLSDLMSRDGGRGGDSDFGKATKYGKVGKEDESETIQRINRVALTIYNTLKKEQDARVYAGEDAVSPEKWSNLKHRLLQIAQDEGIPSTRSKFFMRVIVNSLKTAGIIQVNVKADKVMVDAPPEDRVEDVAAISQGVEQIAKKGILGKLFSKFK